MSTPDPDLVTKAAEAGGILTMIISPVMWLNHKLNGKADKRETRDAFVKLFENAENDRKLTRDLHEKAMDAIHQSHRDAMEAINRGQRDVIDAISRIGK